MASSKRQKKKIAVGHKVETKSQPRRVGQVMESLPNYKWSIQFENGSIEVMSSQQIMSLEYKEQMDMISGLSLDTTNEATFSLSSFCAVTTSTVATNPNLIMMASTHTAATSMMVPELGIGNYITSNLVNSPPLGETMHNIPERIEANVSEDRETDLTFEMQSLDIRCTDLDEESINDHDDPHDDINLQHVFDYEPDNLCEEPPQVTTAAWDKYIKEKNDCIESGNLIIKTRKNKKGETKTYCWRAVPNKLAPTREEYPDVQLREFDFVNMDHKEYPFGEMYLQLYPSSDWRLNLAKLNKAIEMENEKLGFKIQMVTEKEWWTFHALMMSPNQVGSNGMAMFSKKAYGLFPAPDFGRYMSVRRFGDIRLFFVYAFYETLLSEEQFEVDHGYKLDPWHRINLLVKEYNMNRKQVVAGSCKKIADELMSPWRPCITKKGGLPHLSFILRKPQPLGTEFKSVACGVTGCMLHIEIQKGKDAMRIAEHSNAYGVTSACSLRLLNATVQSGQLPLNHRQELFLADSWFAGIQTAELVADAGHSFIGPVKTNSGGFPKKELEIIMKEWPAGSSICLEAENRFGTKLGLTALGYKYRKKSSVHFIMTNDAGHTSPGVA